MPRHPPKLTPEDIEFLDELLEPLDDFTLSEDDRQAAGEAAISECGRFKGRDPYSVWMAWATTEGRDT